MPAREDLARAVDLALAGDWGSAHKIVQEDEEDATSCWMPATPATGTAAPGNPTKPTPTRKPSSPPSRLRSRIDPRTKRRAARYRRCAAQPAS